jgi:hypothetical protein
MQQQLQSRFYFDPWAHRVIRAWIALGFLLSLALALGPYPANSDLIQNHTSLAVLARVICTAFAAAFGFLWRAAGRLGVEAGPDGIYIPRGKWGMRRQFVPWSGINTFRMRVAGTVAPVWAELSSGELAQIPLVQGRKMRWRDGASKDMVEVLNQDLARARQASHHRPSPEAPDAASVP